MASGFTSFIFFALASFFAFGRFAAFFVAIVSLLCWIQLLDPAQVEDGPRGA